jgi:hypothetical protein
MANIPTNPNEKTDKKQDDVQIEPLSDQSLEDVAGGEAVAPCPVASCSANVCSG